VPNRGGEERRKEKGERKRRRRRRKEKEKGEKNRSVDNDVSARVNDT